MARKVGLKKIGFENRFFIFSPSLGKWIYTRIDNQRVCVADSNTPPPPTHNTGSIKFLWEKLKPHAEGFCQNREPDNSGTIMLQNLMRFHILFDIRCFLLFWIYRNTAAPLSQPHAACVVCWKHARQDTPCRGNACPRARPQSTTTLVRGPWIFPPGRTSNG